MGLRIPAGVRSKIIRMIQNLLRIGKKMDHRALPAPPVRQALPAPKPKWTPPSNWQGPAVPKRGTWAGDVGNSGFRLSPQQARDMGLPPGTVIQFKNGVPDFGPHAVPGPNGKPPATFPVQGLKYEHRPDFKTAVKEISQQTGMTQKEVKAWLRENEVRLHHFQGDLMQIVPEIIHDSLHHTGSRAMGG